MKSIAVVNLLEKSPYFEKKVGELTQVERIKRYINSLPYIEDSVVLLKEDMDIPFKKIIDKNFTEESLIKQIEKVSEGFDHIFYFYGDTPLIDSRLSNQMFEDHINYYAEYTFADGYPYGLTPEIIDTGIVLALKTLSKDSTIPVKRDSIFNIIKRDINSFELETKIAKVDQRLKRISLTSDNRRNFNLLNRIVNLGGKDAESITDIIEKNEDILFVEPAYVTIDITGERCQNISYLPKRLSNKNIMPINDIEKILSKIKDYSEDCTIAFTPEYEPVTHPDFLKIVDLITNKFNFDLYIETSGIGWTSDLKDAAATNKRVSIIVTLDSIDSELYKTLRGEGYAEALAFSKEILSMMKERTWIQAVRMKNNESNMEAFYRYWQEFTSNIIIQKYSNYNGRLPDLKIADLSPLKRYPCWHLKRDLHINREGDALLCICDINNDHILGSMLSEDIEVIMDRKKSYYVDQLEDKYTDICRNCDEYYTYNF